jgi:hypothetical protein
MRSTTLLRLRLAAVGLGAMLVLAPGAVAAAAEPAAQLSSSAISLDEAAELRVLTDGGRHSALPSVDGLQFRRMGESTEMTSINGAVSQHTWIVYQVVASRPGSYSIPIGGTTLRLAVSPAGARPAPAGVTPRGVFAAPSYEPATQGSLALLRVTLPSRKLYVGQAAPVTFKAYFRPGTQVMVTGPPSLAAQAFTVSQLADNPRQSVESIRGVPYRVATWTGQLAAAMPGRYTTAAMLPIVVRYHEASRRQVEDPLAGMLDDDDAFGSSAMLRSLMSRSMLGGGIDDLFGAVRERTMTVRAPAQAVEVLPLPAGGQPAAFSGAVGHFAVRATLAPTAGTAFEPLSLKIEVSGKGSFDRVSTAGLPSSRDWKTYPPSARLAPDGAKLFEQAVVPQRAGRLELPPVPFSYFDPDRRQYVTVATAPITVQVAPATGGSTPFTLPAAANVPPSIGAPAAQLRPNQLDEGRHVATLLPPYRRPWFWLALSVPSLALALVLARPLRRGRGASARARRRAVRDAVAQQRAAMRRAVGARDPVRFFEAARTALQRQLGARWGIPPEEVTAAEAAARMGEAGAPIVASLRTAESFCYGGGTPDPSSLTEYDETIERQLDEVEDRS